MTGKQIINAQKVLRRLEGTPVKFYRDDGQLCWQVTYDNTTYNALLEIVSVVASEQIVEVEQPTTLFKSVTEYHRDKI